MDPLTIIGITISITEVLGRTYQGIKHLKGLPKEFTQVNNSLPVIEDTLRLVSDHITEKNLDHKTIAAIEPMVNDCRCDVEKLQEIFTKVETHMKSNSKWLSIFLLKLRQGHRVEALLENVRNDLRNLATNQVFTAVTQSQMKQLQQSIVELSKGESSVPNSGLKDSGATMNETVPNGGTAHQYNAQTQNINSGSGPQYNAGNMNFVFPNGNETKTIRDYLRPSPYLDRKNKNPDRVPGTCEWFEYHDKFQQWLYANSSVMLWFSAAPWSGKSVLAKHLIDNVLCVESSATICYFFFKEDIDDQKSAKSALRCILHQLFTQKPQLFSKKIKEQFQGHNAHLSDSVDELWKILIRVSEDKDAGEILCILDALDECESDGERLAEFIGNFYSGKNETMKHITLKFFVTSRPFEYLRKHLQFDGTESQPAIHLDGDLEVTKIKKDIDIYIKHKASRISTSRNLSTTQKEYLLQELTCIENDTYLWVHLMLDFIQSQNAITEEGIQKATSELPETVKDEYERILQKSSDPQKARRMLHIIIAADRPLTLDEMCFALAVKKADHAYDSLIRKLPSKEGSANYIRGLCGLFVSIRGSKVYLIHQTAKEFLVQRRKRTTCDHRKKGVWEHSFQLKESHKRLCNICVNYLRFDDFQNPIQGNTIATRKVEDYVFLDYSVTNWAFHFRESGLENPEAVRLLFEPKGVYHNWFQLFWFKRYKELPKEFPKLMMASYFGIEFMVNWEIQFSPRGWKDPTHSRSALSWASGKGYEDIVKILLDHSTLQTHDTLDINTRDKFDRTPLMHAALNGHVKVVRLLIKAGAKVAAVDKDGGTAAFYARCAGHEEVEKELGSKSPCQSGGSVLRAAVNNGDRAIVKWLLKHDVDANAATNTKWTPLHIAAASREDDIVRLLLKYDAKIEAKTRQNWTPLWLAVLMGHTSTMKLLIKLGADVNARDDTKNTMLMIAAAKGSEPMAKILLAHDAHVFAEADCGQTAMLYATYNNFEKVIRLLVEHRAERKSLSSWMKDAIELEMDRKRSAVEEIIHQKELVVLQAVTTQQSGIESDSSSVSTHGARQTSRDDLQESSIYEPFQGYTTSHDHQSEPLDDFHRPNTADHSGSYRNPFQYYTTSHNPQSEPTDDFHRPNTADHSGSYRNPFTPMEYFRMPELPNKVYYIASSDSEASDSSSDSSSCDSEKSMPITD